MTEVLSEGPEVLAQTGPRGRRTNHSRNLAGPRPRAIPCHQGWESEVTQGTRVELSAHPMKGLPPGDHAAKFTCGYSLVLLTNDA